MKEKRTIRVVEHGGDVGCCFVDLMCALRVGLLSGVGEMELRRKVGLPSRSSCLCYTSLHCDGQGDYNRGCEVMLSV